MRHKGLMIFGGLMMILLIGFIILNFTIDGIVKSAIEENGTELLQTRVDVNSVNISLIDGSGTIYGFTVANPEGFSDEQAIEIDEISIKIDLFTFLSDEIVVESINVQNPELFVEQRGTGVNLRQLDENLDLAEDTGDKSLVIDHLLIENGVVRLSSTIERERRAEARIEKFELNNVGRKDSNTIKQSIRQVLEPLLERAVQEALSRGLMEQLENKLKEFLGGEDES